MPKVAPSRRAQLSVSQELSAEPSVTWRLLSSGTQVERWFPWVAATRVVDAAEGGLRRIELKDGSIFEEFITLNDARTMTYQYYAPAPPLPIRHVIGTHRVEARPEGGTLLSWSVSFEVMAAAPPDIVTTLQNLYRAALAQIDVVTGSSMIHATNA